MNIPETLINELEDAILSHPDALRAGARYGSFRHFFSIHGQWSNGWFSEVARKRRTRITPKLRSLCKFLNVDIERHIMERA